MISNLDKFTAAAVIQLIDSIEPGCTESLTELISMMSCHEVYKNKTLFQAGETNRYEYLLLDGLLRSLILDEKGNETTVAFHSAPCVVTPCIARSENYSKDENASRWGNRVMQTELVRRSQREWSLAAESGAQRLERFEKEHPDLASVVSAKIIATYLGITPVTLSRLRHTGK